MLELVIPPHPLTNFEIQRWYQNELRCNGIHSKDNLPERSSTEIKDGAYITNLDEYSDIGTHWVALYVQNNDITYFDYFGVEHILKRIRTFISNKSIKTNIYWTQAYYSIMRRYFCIECTDFMLAEIILTKFTNLFSPNNFKRNDDIILNYFMTV